ncbi:MAG TPA: flagellar biosynthesis regulator FlaF [Syntrophales bacterium]|jgi:flagellar protein FlaF|nr:flagellar biosynthesis regulator FlaF [Syntrophales bacterium]HRT61050.1 flagellar biosynthesis regulator FlaF [Syntrophales bacterium]
MTQERQLDAYQKTHKMVMTDREVEASVLTKGACMLRRCQEEWDRGGGNGLLDEALRYNQLIWTIFQGELGRKDHPLSREIRQKLLTLSLFIDRRIFEVMAYPEPKKLDAIININLNLAAGLRGSPEP